VGVVLEAVASGEKVEDFVGKGVALEMAGVSLGKVEASQRIWAFVAGALNSFHVECVLLEAVEDFLDVAAHLQNYLTGHLNLMCRLSLMDHQSIMIFLLMGLWMDPSNLQCLMVHRFVGLISKDPGLSDHLDSEVVVGDGLGVEFLKSITRVQFHGRVPGLLLRKEVLGGSEEEEEEDLLLLMVFGVDVGGFKYYCHQLIFWCPSPPIKKRLQ